jgi:hypothetical protein
MEMAFNFRWSWSLERYHLGEIWDLISLPSFRRETPRFN